MHRIYSCRLQIYAMCPCGSHVQQTRSLHWSPRPVSRKKEMISRQLSCTDKLNILPLNKYCVYIGKFLRVESLHNWFVIFLTAFTHTAAIFIGQENYPNEEALWVDGSILLFPAWCAILWNNPYDKLEVIWVRAPAMTSYSLTSYFNDVTSKQHYQPRSLNLNK